LDRVVVRERRAPRGGVRGGDRLAPGPGAVDADNVRSELRKHHGTGSGRRRSSRTRRCAVPRAVGHPFHSPLLPFGWPAVPGRFSRPTPGGDRPSISHGTARAMGKPREQHTWQPARQRPGRPPHVPDRAPSPTSRSSKMLRGPTTASTGATISDGLRVLPPPGPVAAGDERARVFGDQGRRRDRRRAAPAPLRAQTEDRFLTGSPRFMAKG
jgi:hypothetical protein